MISDWFPHPERAEHVRIVPPAGRWAAAEVVALLNDPEGQEWRDRVGVVGRADGSAKASTRLFCARGWVAKTRVDQEFASEDDVVAQLLRVRRDGMRAALWHPSKVWMAIVSEGRWYGATLCPELRTLRRIDAADDRVVAWTEMLRWSIQVSNQYGIGLDLNPANFGTVTGNAELYYIDDELYPPLTERELAGAMVARIPEEPELAADAWSRWALSLVHMLERTPLTGMDWDRLAQEILLYPLTEQFEACRVALHGVFVERLAQRARARLQHARGSTHATLTCVLADVHSNLPALEAVLDAARALGADSYLFVGDAVGYGPHPSECIARLADLSCATFVRGNHDHAIASGDLTAGMNRLAKRCAEWNLSAVNQAERAWLSALPTDHVTDTWMAVHGAPRDPSRFLAYVYDLTYDDNLDHMERQQMPLCFHGHTHVPLVYPRRAPRKRRVADGEVFDLSIGGAVLVNPGSVGQPRDGDPRAAFALWDRVHSRVSFHRVAYDLERTLRDVRARDLPQELADRLVSGT